MMKKVTITGLDIGSSKISAVMAQMDAGGNFDIIAQSTQTSKGISKGVIEDLPGAISSVSKALDKLRSKANRRAGSIYVNISGEGIKGKMARGMVPLNLRGREVTKGDMDRCVNVASTINIPLDKEIVNKVVHHFSIDDQPFIKNPIGLSASRLTCEAYLITAGINHIQNIYKCVDGAGYDVRELVYSGIADGTAILDGEDKAREVFILNIGDSVSNLSLFRYGLLSGFDIVSIGARDIKGDFRDNVSFGNIIDRVNLSAQELLKKGGKAETLIITGGLAFTDGILEYLEEKTSIATKMGVAQDIRGEISSVDRMRITTAIGLARYGYEKLKARPKDSGNFFKQASDKFVDVFNNYF